MNKVSVSAPHPLRLPSILTTFLTTLLLSYKHFVPNQNSKLPHTTLTPKCCPKLQAMLYKYFGLKTVQIKRCVLKSVQAAITNAKLAVTNTVNRLKCFSNTSFSPFFFSRRSMRFVAEVQKIGPDQLDTNVRIPTARTL